jgi:membrane protein DedA with SNARE-associated domain
MELISHWISHYGYLGLFSLLMLGIVGLPVPDETLLTFTGYLLFRHKMHLYFALPSAFLGSICGITISYLLGKSLGFFLLRKYGRYVFVTEEKVNLVHDWFLKNGKWSLLIGYYLPGIRHLTAYVAGATKLEYPTFMLFAYTGGLIWTMSFISLGYFLGDQWQKVLDQINDNLMIGTVILIAIFSFFWFVKKRFVKI